MNKEKLEELRSYGLSVSDILLPKSSTDYFRWATVACDQFTSQKDYWQEVERITDGYPTTFRLIYPECYLEEGDKEKRIHSINSAMNKYLEEGLFDTYKDCFILVERTTESGTRLGLMVSLDLECYSYAPDSKTLIRATEGTILSRIPPRKEIRKNAPLELPHIMVLISDEKRSIIEPLSAKKDSLKKVYDTDLMQGGGHVTGYLVDSDEDIALVAKGFKALTERLDPENPLLFAMGDGNHSLATAKSCWEDIKATLTEEEKKDHPARYALVELENIFDEALMFEPIHRTFFNTAAADFDDILSRFAKKITKSPAASLEESIREINAKDSVQRFATVTEDGFTVYSLEGAKSSIAAGTIQSVIDTVLSEGKGDIDYIHGADVAARLGAEKGNIGIILPDVSKETFFDSIIRDRAFPRKTFSIGHAEEKRYYIEAKRIR